MNWSTENIKKNIEIIMEDINDPKHKNKLKGQLEAYLIDKYPDFAKAFPFLLKRMAKKENMEYLDVMIKGIADIESKTQSKESVEQEIGDKLAEQYFYPTMSKINADALRKKVSDARIKK